MKKFVIKCTCFLCFCLLVTVVFPAAVDPYNVFHYESIRDNGIEPNKNYIKTKYLIDNPDKYDALLFGSSRVGAIHTEKMLPEYNCYNMTYSFGLPQEHLDNIRVLLDNGVHPKTIFLGVDSISYTYSPLDHINEPLRCPYSFSQSNPTEFYKLYFNPMTTIRSLKNIMTYTPGSNPDFDATAFYSYGWWCDYDIEEVLTPEKDAVSLGSYFLMEECLDSIREIKKLCDDNGIELIVFTNPMYKSTYEASVADADYEVFLSELAKITDFYNFSELNDITSDMSNFVDNTHYNAYVGDAIIDVIVFGKEDLIRSF